MSPVETRLKQVIIDANEILFDEVSGLDIEHEIHCHAATLPEAYRRLAEAAKKALELVQNELFKEL